MLGLNRPELAERRFDHFQILLALRDLTRLVSPESEEARAAEDVLGRAVGDGVEYASMARALLGAME